MSKHGNKEQMNETIEVEDLTIEESTLDEVKGGSGSSANNLKQIGIGIHNIADSNM